MKRNFLFLLLFLLGFGISFTTGTLQAENSRQTTVAAADKKSSSDKQAVKTPEQKISFQWHQKNLVRHFNKHRSEFPEYKTAQEYGDAAVKFFSNPPDGTLFKRRSSGDRLFYYEKSNFFGVTTKDGFIKTFFRPNRGKKYWARQ